MLEVINAYRQGREAQLHKCEPTCELILCLFLLQHSQHTDSQQHAYQVRLISALHQYLEDQIEPNYCKKNDAVAIPQLIYPFLLWLAAQEIETEKISKGVEDLCQWLYIQGYTHMKMKKA